MHAYTVGVVYIVNIVTIHLFPTCSHSQAMQGASLHVLGGIVTLIIISCVYIYV